MIEIEKKFLINPKDLEKIFFQAEFLNEKVFTDIYYDNANYDLTKKDCWLRQRDGKFEYKIPVGKKDNDKTFFNRYEEIENEEEICQKLNLVKDDILEKVLANAGYLPFCELKTTRKKLKEGEFIIDIDLVEYKDFTFNIVEIELMVENESEIEEAKEKIFNFAKSKNLIFKNVLGKVIEYLKQKNPVHYQALVKSGTVIE